jgi:hypothetical protein
MGDASEKTIVRAVVIYCLSICSMVTAASNSTVNDVSTNHWAYASVQELINDGLIDDTLMIRSEAINRLAVMKWQLVDKALHNQDKATVE